MISGAAWSASIRDIDFYVDGEEMGATEAFDEIHEPLYDIVEWYNDPDKRSYSTSNSDYMPDELAEPYQEWMDRRAEPNSEIVIKRTEGNNIVEEVYDIELRMDDPKEPKKPYSAMNGVHQSSNQRIGIRILRDYDPEILYRNGDIDPEVTLNSEVRSVTSEDIDDQKQQKARNGEVDDESLKKLGWIREPYLQAALDRRDGVDWQIVKDGTPELVPLNWEKHAYVDYNTNPSYEHSNLDVAVVYDWLPYISEGVGMQNKDHEAIARHAGTMHALGLTNWLDRTSDELYWDTSPERGEKYAMEGDLEFVNHTTDQELLDKDLEDFKEIAVSLEKQANKRDKISPDRKNEIREIIETRRDEVVDGVQDSEIDLETFVLENVPSEWDPRLFSDHKRIGL